MDYSKIIMEAKKITKTYRIGSQIYPILRGIDLKILESAMIAVVGPSGSGKTTLLNILGGLDSPTSGEVLIGDKILTSFSDKELAVYRRDMLGMVFQEFHLISGLSAGENVQLPLLFSSNRMSKAQLLEKAFHALQRVEMSDWVDHYPEELSSGQKQRVCIARALVNQPKLILADEPTGNLDTTTGDKIVELLKDQTKTGVSIIVVTHDPAVAEIADSRFILREGVLSQLK